MNDDDHGYDGDDDDGGGGDDDEPIWQIHIYIYIYIYMCVLTLFSWKILMVHHQLRSDTCSVTLQFANITMEHHKF